MPSMAADTLVMGAAIIRHGRVLAARRTAPVEARGFWELPGGKVESGEDPTRAVVREIEEELGCRIRVTGHLLGEQTIRSGYTLRVATADLFGGEPTPREHDALRWLGPEDLDDVEWLAADRPFLSQMRELLLDGTRLEGGNVHGAVRIGGTVRRVTGPWTPAVHRLLEHLRERGLPGVPQVLGTDERGREVLTYLPGDVVDVDRDLLNERQLEGLAHWARRFHDVVVGFDDPGPWRYDGVDESDIVAHNDLAPYNACFQGDHLTGVFDWDLAGPSTRLLELAHLAWVGVPMFRVLPVTEVARRLRVVVDAYQGPSALKVLHAVPVRVRLAVDGIRAGVAAGDEGMCNLTLLGEPGRTEEALAGLAPRIPAIEEALVKGHFRTP
jgi:8-oxo-dGTP diphosphatase